MNHRGFMSNRGIIDADRVAILEAALSALPEANSTEHALLLATWCSELAIGTALESANSWPTTPAPWPGGSPTRPP